jgi:hypothetical protein
MRAFRNPPDVQRVPESGVEIADILEMFGYVGTAHPETSAPCKTFPDPNLDRGHFLHW